MNYEWWKRFFQKWPPVIKVAAYLAGIGRFLIMVFNLWHQHVE